MFFYMQLFIDCLLAFFFSSLIHELGHAITAKYYNWNFKYIIVGPFCLEKNAHNCKLCFRLEKNINLWGGVTCYIPNQCNQQSYFEFSKILLSGPLTSIIASFLLLLVFLFTKSYLALLTFGICLGIGIVCIVPFPIRTGIGYTDGYRYHRIKTKSDIYDDEYVIFQLSTISFFKPNITYDDLNKIISSSQLSNDYSLLFYLHYTLLELAAEMNDYEKQTHELNIINEFICNVPQYLINSYPISKYDNDKLQYLDRYVTNFFWIMSSLV